MDIGAGAVQLPSHWQLFINSFVGAFFALIYNRLKKLSRDREIKDTLDMDHFKTAKEKEIKALQNDLKVAALERDISEKNLMLNSAIYNEKWLISNADSKRLREICDEIDTRTELLDKVKKGQIAMLKNSVNGLNKATEKVLKGDINPEIKKAAIKKEMEKLRHEPD